MVTLRCLFAGYYADVSTGCQVYHVCSAQGSPVKNSFLCNNGSIFNQERFVCDWWLNVDCPNSERSFDLNLEIGKTSNSISEGGSSGSSFASSGASSSGGSYNTGSSGAKFTPSTFTSQGGSASAGGSYNGGSSSFGSGGSSFGSTSFGGSSSQISSDSGSNVGSGSGSKSAASNGDSLTSSLTSSGASFPSASQESDSETNLAASLSQDNDSGPSSGDEASFSSSPSSDDSLAASLGDNSLYNGASAAAGASSAVSYPGPSAGFSPDTATGGIDLRVGGGSSSRGRLSPSATSSLRASFARQTKFVGSASSADEIIVAASSQHGPIRFGERLSSPRSSDSSSDSSNAASPAKDLEAPTFKRRRGVRVTKRRIAST